MVQSQGHLKNAGVAEVVQSQGHLKNAELAGVVQSQGHSSKMLTHF